MKPPCEKEKILIVDDEPTNIQALFTLLKDSYQIKVANNGIKACEIAQQMQPDLILLDVIMPGIDGYVTCKALKNDPLTAHIPIIFVTANEGEAQEAKGFEVGAIDYITKPFSPIVVKARIKTQLNLKHLRENLQDAVEVEVKERMKMQEKLAAQDALLLQSSKQAAMGEMISLIAHQWKQPLGAIAAIAAKVKMFQALEKFDLQTPKGREEQDEFLEKSMVDINKSIQFLVETMDEFRNFFRPDRKKESVSLDSLIKKSLRIMGKSLENHKIEVNIDSKSNCQFDSYENQLTQVVINLLKNAQDAFVEKDIKSPTIWIRTYESAQNLILEIEDNAGGIDKSVKDCIFDPYVSTKSNEKGTGIGLYMSKTIIQEHAYGTINVINTHEGAKFTIALPKSRGNSCE